MSLTFEDYPVETRQAWVAFEMFRRLGFSADDIYFVIGRSAFAIDGPPCFAVQLRTQDKDFTIIAGHYTTEDEVRADMAVLPALTKSLDDFDKDEVMNFFFATMLEWGGAVDFVQTLQDKGFEIPIMKGLD